MLNFYDAILQDLLTLSHDCLLKRKYVYVDFLKISLSPTAPSVQNTQILMSLFKIQKFNLDECVLFLSLAVCYASAIND